MASEPTAKGRDAPYEALCSLFPSSPIRVDLIPDFSEARNFAERHDLRIDLGKNSGVFLCKSLRRAVRDHDGGVVFVPDEIQRNGREGPLHLAIERAVGSPRVLRFAHEEYGRVFWEVDGRPTKIKALCNVGC